VEREEFPFSYTWLGRNKGGRGPRLLHSTKPSRERGVPPSSYSARLGKKKGVPFSLY